MNFFSNYYHHASKLPSPIKWRGIPLDDSLWPEEWKTILLRDYERFPKLALANEPLSADLFKTLEHRRTRRNFSAEPLSSKEISTLLKYSCGKPTSDGSKTTHHRAQPSGGSLFPIEMYLIVFKQANEIAQGIYHYNIKEHALDVLWDRTFDEKDRSTVSGYPWVADASVLFVMTGVFSRNTDKYAERAYRYILLEAGHIGQNLCLVAEALKLRICPLGGVRDLAVEKMIDIDGVSESVIYVLAAGK